MKRAFRICPAVYFAPASVPYRSSSTLIKSVGINLFQIESREVGNYGAVIQKTGPPAAHWKNVHKDCLNALTLGWIRVLDNFVGSGQDILYNRSARQTNHNPEREIGLENRIRQKCHG
ncbi:MAG TPA: hypothetical protein VKX49_23150 [Bryobacteraceae bacterium]|nr:hypothetical protein [Bryobacteraceae bacterium]